jgi:hypothetical protein
MASFPATVGDLIAELDKLYPEYVPTPGDSPEKIFHAAGQRAVVVHLKKWRESASRPAPAPRPRGQGRPVSTGA